MNKLSHDIRTPVAAILASVDHLRGSLPKVDHPKLSGLQSSTVLLSNIVELLLWQPDARQSALFAERECDVRSLISDSLTVVLTCVKVGVALMVPISH